MTDQVTDCGSPANRDVMLEPGVRYVCQRCTACCRWPGQVVLSEAELSRLARFKGLSEFEFIQEWTRLRADRKGLALKDKPDGTCIFLEGDNCAVQSVKPQQCRDFPNRWNFSGFEKFCKAIPREMGDEEYQARVLATTTPPSPQ